MCQACNKVKVTSEVLLPGIILTPKTFFFFSKSVCWVASSMDRRASGALHLGLLQGFSFSLPPSSSGDPSPTLGEIPK